VQASETPALFKPKQKIRMKKIETMTPEQEAQVELFREQWRKKALSTDRVDQKATKEAITKMYELIGKKPPIFLFCPSLQFAQFQINFCRELFAILKEQGKGGVAPEFGDNLRENLGDNLWYNLGENLRDNLWDNLRYNLGDNLRYNLGENLRDNLWDNLRYNLGENLGDNLRYNLGENLGDNLWYNLRYNLGDNLRYNLGDNLQKNLKYEHTYFWGNMDAYWIAFYQFPEKFLGIKYKTSDSEKLELWSKVAESASWFWTYENYCFVSDRPTSYGFDEEYRMHSSTGPAIEFTDGWKLYRWHGVEVPENWILAPETIKKQDVINEQNAEKRRCLMEILGPEKFSEMLGVLVIDQDTDQGGRARILYRTKNIDPVAEEHIHFARVICPSTEREYFLCVPNTINNIWDAVAWTFKKNKANYQPIIET
jgi:hypothetical protein